MIGGKKVEVVQKNKDLKIAILITNSREDARVHGFENRGNIGVLIIKDVLERAGYSVGWCSVDTAKNFDAILVSFPSNLAIFDYLKAVKLHPEWQPEKRKFIVIAGGAGMANVYPIRNFVDFAVFGRGEHTIVPLVEHIFYGKSLDVKNVMKLPDEIKEVEVAQTDQLYPYPIKIKKYGREMTFKETTMGCERKCAFCYYTYSRKWLSETKNFHWDVISLEEVLFDRLIRDTKKHSGMVKTALDGFSERLRLAMFKPITNKIIVDILTEASRIWRSKLSLKIYMIGSYPTETKEDVYELREVLKQVEPYNEITISLHVTPFVPTPLAPGKFLPANIDFEWGQFKGMRYLEKGKMVVWFNHYITSLYNHFLAVFSVRAKPEHDELLQFILFNKKFNRLSPSQKMYVLQKKFDLNDIIREYRIDEEDKLATWYLNTYISKEVINKIALNVKRKLGMEAK